ncbi:hypothetical protein L218DRAFT_994017 [Marasmius fiardii PR-910]|nr:hypothetical protein L218DRAFT_994017 [Marasmius fiardii PR-910]
MSENQPPKQRAVIARHTVHFGKHHLGPTRLFAHPSHRTTLPARTILRKRSFINSGSYHTSPVGTHHGSGHSTRTTRVLSCVTNVELISQDGTERLRSKRKSIIVTSPSSTRRYQSSNSPSKISSVRKSPRLPQHSPGPFLGAPLSTRIYSSPAADSRFPPPPDPYCASPLHSPQPHSLTDGSASTPGTLDIYAHAPPGQTPPTSHSHHTFHCPPHSHHHNSPTLYQPNHPPPSFPPSPPVLLHPELTSHCPLLWMVHFPPGTAKSRYPIPYPFDLDFLNAPACPGASSFSIYIEGAGGLVGLADGLVRNLMNRWGPIKSSLRPGMGEVTVFEVLVDIYEWLRVGLTAKEERYVRRRGLGGLVDGEKRFRASWEASVAGAGGGQAKEWENLVPPRRVDVIGPLCGRDFFSMRFCGLRQATGCVEVVLRLGWF